jgi:hypothetical protein
VPGAGTGTTGGKVVHQQGSVPPSAMAQPKGAPQRVQMLMPSPQKMQQVLIMPHCE